VGAFAVVNKSGYLLVLHADMTHLIFNMLTLWFFAPVVISYLGDFPFNDLFWESNFGSLLTMFFTKDDYGYRAVGASGAVTGVLDHITQPDMMLGIFCYSMPAYILEYFIYYSIYGA
jgi:membrane associated rhomboid family serine protease